MVCRSPLHHACSAKDGQDIVELLLLVGNLPILCRIQGDHEITHHIPWDYLFNQAVVMRAIGCPDACSILDRLMPRPSIWTSVCRGEASESTSDQQGSVPCTCGEASCKASPRSQLQWPPWVLCGGNVLQRDKHHEHERPRARPAEVFLNGTRNLSKPRWTDCGKPLDGSTAAFAEVRSALSRCAWPEMAPVH
jgi:hypothetical protein